MDETLTLGRLIDSLAELAAHLDRDTPIRINGEYAAQFMLQVQNPLKSAPNRLGIVELDYDHQRKQVIDLAVNGHNVPMLPVYQFNDLHPASAQT